MEVSGVSVDGADRGDQDVERDHVERLDEVLQGAATRELCMESLERDEQQRTEEGRGPREVELCDGVLCRVRVHVEEDGERAGDVLLGLQPLRDDGCEEQHACGDGELLGEAGWRDQAHVDDALVAGG